MVSGKLERRFGKWSTTLGILRFLDGFLKEARRNDAAADGNDGDSQYRDDYDINGCDEGATRIQDKQAKKVQTVAVECGGLNDAPTTFSTPGRHPSSRYNFGRTPQRGGTDRDDPCYRRYCGRDSTYNVQTRVFVSASLVASERAATVPTAPNITMQAGHRRSPTTGPSSNSTPLPAVTTATVAATDRYAEHACPRLAPEPHAGPHGDTTTTEYVFLDEYMWVTRGT